jgi:hypothetical protein
VEHLSRPFVRLVSLTGATRGKMNGKHAPFFLPVALTRLPRARSRKV